METLLIFTVFGAFWIATWHFDERVDHLNKRLDRIEKKLGIEKEE